MKYVLFQLYLLVSFSALAAPGQVEIVFLSEPTATSSIERNWTSLGKVSANDFKDECIKTGDGCFHPQLGFIPDDADSKVIDEKPARLEYKTFNSDEVNLVECREGEYFDIFCGKAKKQIQKTSEVEIWIDTSSSLRKMDYSSDPARCVRRSFVEKLQDQCSDSKLSVMTYDTSIKLSGSNEGLCQNYGTNDTERFIKWIKASEAKYLFIVTDIDELNHELRDYLDSIGAIYHGSGVKSTSVKDLESYVSIVKKQCV
ncbi:MAG: hypothetical protein COW01_10780 [Bdellovibrionales bacterium CG12_big_fil_rev_8_21_14_0_65_38_15]|nr:MAG: hypothetical protein COW79_07625 [Bdellovibrionales bacterium CG22_combo_CG10-13_8_21_14_all_38_13]PIQ54620.1 MAG: hypothetical protein COW01_10780 [Bdellovibrionales bacterium CG12_big_fil_rev_8_21_14_0_65_38_15]PIR30001.1 MAG: hypothetical protein COV38_08625 [Bdellovibrionales bacterium CG11_big_fil_rev_8_21_14_0_20_38_13]